MRRRSDPAVTATEPDVAGGRVAWFHCYAGIAGDMALGSLLDAGADEGELRAVLATLPLDGWSMEVTKVLRGGLAASRVEVRVSDDGPPRTLSDLLAIVGGAALAPRALRRSIAAFSLLAELEGSLHGEAPGDVHFHELGGHDTIVDVVATMVALELLGIGEVTASPVATGTGTVRSAHGTIPNPAPAVLAVLTGAPVYGRDIGVELTTPTGAAILAATGATYGPMPSMTLEAVGYGAGARDLDGLPNTTQVVLGTRTAVGGGGTSPAGQPLLLLEANVDDASGEELADALAAMLDAGAADAWTASVLMKKGRPGHVVSALVDVARADALREVMLTHTGSLGVRTHLVDRYALARRLDEVEIDGSPVRLKISPSRVKVEHDDAAAIARRTGKPVREVVRRAERAYAERLPRGGEEDPAG
ncbi:MAG: Pyridinium-3,5-bisthiocarboxylic acid mononucleotide nickel insertion protein [Acidimicrobiaceae bacterium]|jgi:uncharacterized protein (TIGR00299 family) protein|nr:Pyridinium-3,5-bisthiocarboxylic acid mononucleotide nickel insertion protein [Acidimicrobiaceae bacterium]